MNKTFNTRRALGTCLLLAISSLAIVPVGARAQAPSYPSKPIRLVVPFPPGGPSDALGRLLANQLAKSMGAVVTVDNRPGGNTVIGAQAVTAAPADGYTLLLALDSTLTVNQSLYAKPPYDPLKDFTLIGRVAEIPVVVATNPAFPAKSLQELITLARQRPGQIQYGASAIPMQLLGETFGRQAGIQMQAIPFRGAAQSVQALLAGDIQLSFESAGSVLPHWQAGKLRVLATTGTLPLAKMPGLPTVASAGLPGFNFSVWTALVGPAGMPTEIVKRLNDELQKIMNTPEVAARLAELDIVPSPSTPDALTVQVRADSVRWDKLIRELGLKVE